MESGVPGSQRLSFVHRIEPYWRRLPERLRDYVSVLLALIGGTVLAAILLRLFGDKARVAVSLLGDIVFLGAAWVGYGPGILVLALIVFIVPRILQPERAHPVDLGQFLLLGIISLLISRISSSRRQLETRLRRAAEDLEARVEERTMELRRNEATRTWLAAIVESSPDAIIGKTLDGTITSWNEGAQSLYGYRRDEVLGRSVSILMPPDAADEFASIMQRIKSGEAIRHADAVRLHKDGTRVDVSLSISPVRDDQGVIHGASTIARDMTAQRRVQQALQDSEYRHRLLFDSNPQPMWVYDCETLAFLTVNSTAIRNYGYTADEFLRMTLKEIRPEEDIPKLLDATARPRDEFTHFGQWRHRKKDGQIINVEIAEHPIAFSDRPARLVMAIDVTEKIRLEEQFRQAQRMETVGCLAGGVAHDFNNLLTVINGYSDLLIETVTDRSTVDALNHIRHAGERAAGLTQQLLAFSRKQMVQPVVIDINTVVRDTDKLLRRLIGEDIKLITSLAPDLGLIRADPGQMQQIIMNLAVNSRDAMPNGGTLHLETCNVELDESYRSEHPAVEPGAYVMLVVTDTGMGMTPEIRSRIFEPFFTTKELGKGTGLGLATVYGMVKQGGGWIWVYSEPGRGTAFKIYLPRTDEPLSISGESVKSNVYGSESILIVEDEPEVRALALAGLSAFGYSPCGASTGKEALAICHDAATHIDLVVTDVIMPDMNGRQLADEIARVRPGVRILFMSGYTADVVAHRGELDADVEYLQKPFTPHALARKIRAVLAPENKR